MRWSRAEGAHTGRHEDDMASVTSVTNIIPLARYWAWHLALEHLRQVFQVMRIRSGARGAQSLRTG